ncbi:4'-phosphopantetheinyl transferase superfamily [Russula emetica]|nr:4'-phosphopantetheinyl transferase superfamily [Russula emetica]
MPSSSSSPTVWLVEHPTLVDEFLYQDALTLLDASSLTRVRRFYHRADACRCLIGRLLPRVLLSEQRGLSPEQIHFATTEAGKPYLVASIGPPSIGFNVSHDNELVAMAFAPGEHGPPAFLIGVDVMKIQVPTRGVADGVASFLHAVSETMVSVCDPPISPLTLSFPPLLSSSPYAEKRLVSSDVPENVALDRFYLIWTIKEAYTKAIGLGLGFNPSRIEYDISPNTVAVDGVIASDWLFETSQVTVDGEAYRVTVAQFVGNGHGTGTVVPLSQSQIVCSGASYFVRKALRQLKGKELEGAGDK